MAESSVKTPPRSGEVPVDPAPAERPSPRPTDLATEVSNIDMHDGPDYVDDWMERNLSPSLVEFVRNHCTSFARWDLLRQLHADPSGSSLDLLSSTTGATEAVLSVELRKLEMAGVIGRSNQRGAVTYQLQAGSGLARTLESAVRAYELDREFRFALVYSIVRASHRGAVVE